MSIVEQSNKRSKWQFCYRACLIGKTFSGHNDENKTVGISQEYIVFYHIYHAWWYLKRKLNLRNCAVYFIQSLRGKIKDYEEQRFEDLAGCFQSFYRYVKARISIRALRFSTYTRLVNFVVSFNKNDKN